MVVGKRIILTGLTALLSVISYGTILDYARTPNFNEDASVVKSAAFILSSYKGENPIEAVDYAQKNLSQIPQDSGLRTPTFSKLEGEIESLGKEISGVTNRDFYGLIFKDKAEKLDSFASKYTRDRFQLVAGVIAGLGALFSGAFSCAKDEDLDNW